MRKKVDGWIHAHIDEMIDVIDGFDKKTQPRRHKDSGVLNEAYFSKRRLADDGTFLLDYVRGTNLKLKPFDATKGYSLKETKPSTKDSFAKDLTVFSTLNQKELMKRKARKESSASPSVSDSSSSISMLESSPFSCRTGTSSWAKEEHSPLSLQNSPYRLFGLSRDYVVDGNVLQFLYIPSAKEDKCHSLCQDSSYSQLPLQRNSLGYKIHAGTMDRNYHAEKIATAGAPMDIGKPPGERCTENFGDDFPKENFSHLDDTISSEQECASAITSVIVYSASRCSPKNCSTAIPSQYVPEGVFPRYGEGLKLRMQKREHAARKDDNGCKWNTEPYDDNFTLYPETCDFRIHTSTNEDLQAAVVKSTNDIILDIQSSLNHGFCDTSFSKMHPSCIKRQDGSPQPYFCERCMEVSEVNRLHQTDSTVHHWQAPESNTFPRSGLMQVPTVEKPSSCTMRKRIYPNSTKQITAGHFDIIPIQRLETPCDTNDEQSMKNAERALPANRHIFSASNNTGAHAPKVHFTASTTESNYRGSDLVLRIPCDPFILVPKPIHCFPGPKNSISSRKDHTLSENKDTFLVKDLSIHQTIDDSCILHGQLYQMRDAGFLVYNFLQELEECSGTTRPESRAEAAVSFSAINEHLMRGQFMLYHEDQLKEFKDDVQFTSEKNVAKSSLLTCDNKALQKNDPAIHSVRPNKVQNSMRSVNVTVVLPKGNHNLPSVASSAPSPLIERWKLGGSCDCGGWDVGCGLDIMSTKRSSSCSFRDSIGIMKDNSFGLATANNPFMIFRQDSKDMLVLSLEVIRDGFFSLSFHSQFSQLQAFAVAVAVLHSKETLEIL